MPEIKGTLDQKHLSIQWTIDRFFADCTRPGNYCRSPTFSMSYDDEIAYWQLEVFPKHFKAEYSNYVSLYIHFFSQSSIDIKVNYHISFMGVNQKFDAYTEIAHVFQANTSETGCSELISHEDLKNPDNGILIDDTVTILFEVQVLPLEPNDEAETRDYGKWMAEIGRGFDAYEQVFESRINADVTFNVQGNTFDLHKVILIFRSSVFRAMFMHDMQENKQDFVDLPDVDYDVMREFFRFVYSRKVNNIEEIASDLLIVADKYEVTELKALCEKTLYDNIAVDNVLDYLKLCEMCDTIHLKRLALKYAAVCAKCLIQKPEFKKLSSKLMYEIISQMVNV